MAKRKVHCYWEVRSLVRGIWWAPRLGRWVDLDKEDVRPCSNWKQCKTFAQAMREVRRLQVLGPGLVVRTQLRKGRGRVTEFRFRGL